VLAIVTSTGEPQGVASVGSRPELTFTRVHGDDQSVWVANADGSGARKVVERAYGGRLSADGRWLAYSRPQESSNSGGVPLYVVRLFGGKPRRIGEVRDARWSPRESRLAVADASSLVLVDPASGGRRVLVRGRNLWALSFSPDGHALAYARHNARGGAAFRSDIFVVRLADGVITRLTRDGHGASPLWGPEWIVYERLVWRGGLRAASRLWLMRPDGSGKRFLARGGEGIRNGFPVFGLAGIALSRDGRRLLACQSFEFGCPRVTITVPGGKRHGFPDLTPLERRRGGIPVDLSRDGRRVLVDVGSPHDDRNHGIYELPFAGGRPCLVVPNAIEASWRG
jgi:Tol biopolymer transport system component